MIAILGGAFDPITLGHEQIACSLLEQKISNEVWILPTYIHKFQKNMLDFETRINMCELAFQNKLNIKVTDHEKKFNLLNQNSRGSTYDLMNYLIASDTTNKFQLVIGLDNACVFHKWKSAKELSQLCQIIVIDRKSNASQENLKKNIEEYNLKLTPQIQVMDVSSTQVRSAIFKGDQNYLNEYLNEKVLQFIISQNLYQAR